MLTTPFSKASPMPPHGNVDRMERGAFARSGLRPWCAQALIKAALQLSTLEPYNLATEVRLLPTDRRCYMTFRSRQAPSEGMVEQTQARWLESSPK